MRFLNKLKIWQFAFLMHKQHSQTAYRKDAVLIGTIFENCDKNQPLRAKQKPERLISKEVNR